MRSLELGLTHVSSEPLLLLSLHCGYSPESTSSRLLDRTIFSWPLPRYEPCNPFNYCIN
jgi:hypothetical protein